VKHFVLIDVQSNATEALKLLSGMCNETNYASIPIPPNYIALPDLQTLTVLNATPGDNPSMSDVIAYRETVSKPFKKVRLLVGSDLDEGDLDELRTDLAPADVEFCQKMDPWPPGLDFIDPHDDWYEP
jgi:hypothetical protein